MKTGLFRAKGHLSMGPGGWKCHCCGPVTKAAKKHAVRKHKKRVLRLLDKLEE